MKNIQIYISPKYNSEEYDNKSDGIFLKGDFYYMSISFEQEPEYDEGEDATNISQYPLEDILDKYSIFVSDFYNEINQGGGKICYLELSSDQIENLLALQEIIGKHVYNKNTIQDGEEVVDLIIE